MNETMAGQSRLIVIGWTRYMLRCQQLWNRFDHQSSLKKVQKNKDIRAKGCAAVV